VKEKNAQYNPYEARLIQLLRWRFEQAHFKIEDQLTVGTLPLEIDLIVSAEDAGAIQAELPPFFSYFKRHNVLEIKTEGDRLEPEDLLKLQAYGYLYMEKKRWYAVEEVTTSAIAHHLTPNLFEALPSLKYATVAQGTFKCDAPVVSYIFSLADLQEELLPEELLIFSNAKRRQRVFLSNFQNREKKTLLETIIDLYKNEAIILMEQLGIKPESMRSFIDAIGVDKVTNVLSKEERLKDMSREEIISAMGGRESLLRMLFPDIEPEQVQKLLAQSHRN
jgi:hypothetical protein